MYFNVSQLLKAPSGSQRTFDVDEMLTLTDDRHLSRHLSRVLGTVRVLRTDKSIWVSAALDSEVVCTCSRCLVQFEQPVHFTIEEEFFPMVDVSTGGRVARSEDVDESSYIDANHILDLREVAKQYSTLTVPMKPVCSEDCRGLCSSCGANLNEAPCTCDKTPKDLRWGPLLELASTQRKDG